MDYGPIRAMDLKLVYELKITDIASSKIDTLDRLRHMEKPNREGKE